MQNTYAEKRELEEQSEWVQLRFFSNRRVGNERDLEIISNKNETSYGLCAVEKHPDKQINVW